MLHRHHRPYLIRATVVLASILLLCTGVYAYLRAASTPEAIYPALSEAKRHIPFPAILPVPLPQDTTVIQQPLTDSKLGTLTTTLRDASGATVTLSQQKKPQIDLTQLDAQEKFTSSVGNVYILKGETGRRQAIVDNAASWVLVNAPDALSVAKFKAIITSLKEL